MLRVGTVLSCTFSTSGVSFAIGSVMTLIAAVEALHHLKLCYESFCGVVKVIDVAPVCDTFVCCIMVVQIYYDRTAFRFTGRFLVFTSEERVC